MANREALRELQTRLAQRMQAARTQQRVQSWLALECAGQGFLFALHQAGEIFPVARIIAVPHTQPWFLGVANLRGGLHGVVDLAEFFGLKRAAHVAEAAREHARLLALNPALGLNCALRVDRLAGLRNADQLVLDAERSSAVPAFVGPRWRDQNDRVWQEIELAELARHAQFLGIAA